MKNYILLLTLALLNIQNLFSQDCEFKRKGIDETTNEKIIDTKDIALIMELTRSMDISLMKNGHQYSLIVSYKNTDFTMFNSGDVLLFKLNNDNIITLKSSENAISDISNKVNLTYPIKENELQAIASMGIKKLRIYAQNKYADHEINPAMNGKFVRQVKCVLNN